MMRMIMDYLEMLWGFLTNAFGGFGALDGHAWSTLTMYSVGALGLLIIGSILNAKKENFRVVDSPAYRTRGGGLTDPAYFPAVTHLSEGGVLLAMLRGVFYLVSLGVFTYGALIVGALRPIISMLFNLVVFVAALIPACLVLYIVGSLIKWLWTAINDLVGK